MRGPATISRNAVVAKIFLFAAQPVDLKVKYPRNLSVPDITCPPAYVDRPNRRFRHKDKHKREHR
jgi:hypothetical protein